MRRMSIVLLVMCLVAAISAEAAATQLGLGGFVGMNIPVAQDDASSGALFGFRARLEFMPRLGAEAFFTSLNQGESSVEVWGRDMTVDGGSINSFGLNLIFGSMSSAQGAHFHFTGGIGSYSISRDGPPDESRFGYNFGPGLEIGLGKVSVEIDAKFHVITLDGGGTRKNVGISGGLNYYFGLGDTY